MKKKSLLLLMTVFLVSLGLFSGLIIYAFQLQAQKEIPHTAQNQAKVTGNATITPTKATAVVTKVLTPTVSIGKSANSGSEHEKGRPFVLGFAGDVNLDESYYPVAKYDKEKGDINQCFSADLLKEMRSADIMMLNNEFSYSTRGTKASDKSFTFRAKPERVEILKKMGVDVVSLANNHALDYGTDALLDTFDTLDHAGIDYVGAGKNMDRAKAPVYKTIGNTKVAFVAASHVIFTGSWYATADRPGMVGTYDPTMIVPSIREAKANSGFVVIFVHWGVERHTTPESYQRNLAKIYIDAGADAVIGCHPHVMQGFEFYKGKPIAYSLGNYWFNASANKSGMIKLYVDSEDKIKVQLLPAMNKNTVTYLLTDKTAKKNYYDYIKSLSYDVTIDQDGFLTSVK